MRLARVNTGSEVAAAIVENDTVTLLDVRSADPLLTLLADSIGLSNAVARTQTVATLPVTEVEFLAPVRRPGKIIAIGLNYHDHTAETGLATPTAPLTFAKYPSSITDPAADIVIPTAQTQQVDYEAELAVVIGSQCPPDGSATTEAVAAYTVANDVSARDVQFGDQQWTRGKSFDTFTPLGPWLVTADEVPDPHDLRIWTRVNGEVLQDDTTKAMVFDIPALLTYVSNGTSLEPGDVILTGTPSGAGAFADPPRYLAHGDLVEVGVDSIGQLRNTVRFQ